MAKNRFRKEFKTLFFDKFDGFQTAIFCRNSEKINTGSNPRKCDFQLIGIQVIEIHHSAANDIVNG